MKQASREPFGSASAHRKGLEKRDYLKHIQMARNDVTLGRRFQNVLEAMGYAYFIYSILHVAEKRLYMICCTYPDGIRRIWGDPETQIRDPLIPHLARTTTPIRRSDIGDDGSWAPTIFTKLRQDHQITPAWHLAVHDGSPYAGVFAVAGNAPVADQLGRGHFEEMELILPGLCLQAHERWTALTSRAAAVAGPELKPAEVEVLNWLSVGKSTEDIAEIMTLSERTVNYHVTRIKDKLGVATRAHAVAQAMRFGLI